MRNVILRKAIVNSLSTSSAESYFSYKLNNPQVLADAAKDIMASVPPFFGDCALLSASWAGYLQDHYSIPAIVVVGDLEIKGKTVFHCKENLPDFDTSGTIINKAWDGHCWIEIDGWIGDLSIFRTAYAIKGPSLLKEFIINSFGLGRGAMIGSADDLPNHMKYVPKFILKENQMNALISGMIARHEGRI